MGECNPDHRVSCVLRGELKHLEEIKECIIREYVEKGLVDYTEHFLEKENVYLLTEEQWEEYQRLKEKLGGAAK